MVACSTQKNYRKQRIAAETYLDDWGDRLALYGDLSVDISNVYTSIFGQNTVESREASDEFHKIVLSNL